MTDMTMSIDLMGNYAQDFKPDMVGFHIKKKKFTMLLYCMYAQVRWAIVCRQRTCLI